MPLYQYKGRDHRGEAVAGKLEAASADVVASQLINNGVNPINIREAAEHTALWARLRARLGEGRVKIVDLIFFSRQMHTLLKAGVPILQALRGLRDTTDSVALATVIGDIHDSLDSGLDLTQSLRRHPEVFTSLYISLVEVGETSGNLDEIFMRLSSYLEREKDTRERVKMAIRYPSFVITAIVIGMAILNIWVIPAFGKLYGKFNAELPWATKWLIAMSDFTVAWWPMLLAGFVAVMFGLSSYLKTDGGRYRWHRFALRLPVIGRILFLAALSRFARAMELGLRAGVPLVHGMTMVARAMGNDYLCTRVLGMRDGIERGESITRTAQTAGLFPPLVLQMMSVGEESGALDTMMVDIGDYYEREVDYGIKSLSANIEPILIGFVAIMVFIMALGVFLPMWDLSQAVSKR